jgi:hypothetical protein
VQANVTFGQVTVDGKKLGSPPVVFQARPGGDEVALSATPFATQTCLVSLANDSFQGPNFTAQQVVTGGSGASGDNTCGTFSSSPGDTLKYQGQLVMVNDALIFSLGPNDIPPALLASAQATASQFAQSLSQTTTVPAGDYYATGRDTRGVIQIRRATAPLTATITLKPYIPAQQPNAPLDPSCVGALCPAYGAFNPTGPFTPNGATASPPHGRIWSVRLVETVHWRFSSSQGATLGTLDSSANDAISLSLWLGLDSASDWKIVKILAAGDISGDTSASASGSAQQQALQALSQNLCSLGWQELANEQAIEQPGNTSLQDSGMLDERDLGANGCEMRVQDANGAPTGTLIWRFGALLAADRAARAQFPWLSLASPTEIKDFA